MKIQALILILLFSVYFFSGLVVASCSEVKPANTVCCKRMATKQQPPIKCPKSSENKTSNCYNCPLIYIAMLTPAVTMSLQSVPVEKVFSLLQNGKLNKFPSAVWKPPNVL